MRAVLFLLAFLPFQVFAAPSAAVQALIRKSYDPKVQFYAGSEGLSGFNCPIERVVVLGKDPISGASRPVEIKHYLPRNQAGDPQTNGKALIVMPPTGGENILDQQYANWFCARGYRVALVQSWNMFSDEEVALESYDRIALRALIAIRHTTSYLAESGAKSIGIIGTSLGAIQATAAIGIEPRIKAGVLIVGGIGLPRIIATSDEQSLAQFRQIRMSMWRMDQEAYEKALAKAIHLEPADYIGMSGPKKVFSVIALKDTTVETPAQWKLYEAFGKQELVTFPKDHFGAVKAAGLGLKTRFTEFFDQNL